MPLIAPYDGVSKWTLGLTNTSMSEFNSAANYRPDSLVNRTQLRDDLVKYLLPKLKKVNDYEYLVEKTVKDFLILHNNQTSFAFSEIEEMLDSQALLCYLNKIKNYIADSLVDGEFGDNIYLRTFFFMYKKLKTNGLKNGLSFMFEPLVVHSDWSEFKPIVTFTNKSEVYLPLEKRGLSSLQVKLMDKHYMIKPEIKGFVERNPSGVYESNKR